MTHITDWDQIEKYLRADVYQEIQDVAPNKQEEMCIRHLDQLLRAVLTYVPRHLALKLMQEPLVAQNEGQFLEGTLLFADISGFTSLSEKLKEMGGKEGAEEVVRVINAYLDEMLGVLFKYNGLLIKFGGDAMLCLFTDKDAGGDHGAMNGLRAAWEMKQTMGERFSTIEVFQQTFPLGMKVGGNSGLLFAASVGTSDHMEYVLTGSVVEHTARAESAASKGDVLVSRETYELVKQNLKAEELEKQAGFYRVTDISLPPAVQAQDQWAEIEGLLSGLANDMEGIVERLDSLTPYLPSGVLSRLVHDPQQGQIEGQHRPVTILFANFVGMSDVIHARGVGDEAGITFDLGQYFRVMQEKIQHYGGAVNKVDLYDQGDKLIVTFGAPEAQEYDAQYAARTALAMQEAMSGLSSFLSQRIGINTGVVFAGNVGSSRCNRREYTVMGDDVNLAARLMTAAAPGQVLISQSVWDQIQGGFEAQALEPVRVKGKKDLIPIYLLQAERPGWEDRLLSRKIRSDMVGREAELAELEKRFRDLLFRGRRQVIAITGEAGVGKSRLVDEWQRWAKTVSLPPDVGGTVTWLTGRGRQSGRKANNIFIEIVRQLLAFDKGDSQDKRWHKLSTRIKATFADSEPGWYDEYSNKLVYLANFLGLDFSKRQDLAKRIELLKAQERQTQIYLAVHDLLTHAAQAGPLVLTLEDLHWADRASLDMLQFILKRVGYRSPIFFCLIYRPRIERPIWRVWREIEKEHPGSRLIALEELEDENCRRLLFNLMQTEQVPADFTDLVLRTTDGNPLYVEEVLLSLMDKGDIVRRDEDEAGWKVEGSVDRIDVPGTLRQIIQSRIDELASKSPGAHRALWMAAVIGDEFSEEVWRRLFVGVGGQESEFHRHLDELQQAQMIREVEYVEDEGVRWVWQFRHGLVRQAACENMLVQRWREYHREVGCLLEQESGDRLREQYAVLAHHFVEADDRRGVDYGLRAGDDARAIYANQDALYHYGHTLTLAEKLLKQEPDGGLVEQIIGLHSGMAEVHHLIGEYEAAHGSLQAMLELLPDVELEADERCRRMAAIHWRIAHVYEYQGCYDEAMTELHTALTTLQMTKGPALSELAVIYRLIGWVQMRQGDYRKAIASCEKGLQAALPNDQAVIADLYDALGFIYRRLGEYDRATIYHRDSLVLREQLDDQPGIAKTCNSLAIAIWRQGDYEQAITHYQNSLDISERIGQTAAVATLHNNLGAVYHFDLKQYDRAIDFYKRALSTHERIGDQSGVAMALGNLGEAYRDKSDLMEADGYAQLALEKSVEIGDHEGLIHTYHLLAEIYLARDDPTQAVHWGQQALEVADSMGARLDQADAHKVLGQACLALGQPEQARTHIEAARRLFRDLGNEEETVAAEAALHTLNQCSEE